MADQFELQPQLNRADDAVTMTTDRMGEEDSLLQPGPLHSPSMPMTATSIAAAEPSEPSENDLDVIDKYIFGSIDFLSPWFPDVDPEKPSWKSKRSRRKVVIWTAFGSIMFVCLLNTIFTIVAWAHFPHSSDGVAILYQGNCSTAKNLDAGLHVLINVLSTILLGFSNLSLQLMVSPTRLELDNAHKNGKWFDIGVPSIRNMWKLPRPTIAIALLLAMSSFPIHFLYNASVFSTVSANSYLYAIVTEGFLQPASADVLVTLSNGTVVPAPRDIEHALQKDCRLYHDSSLLGERQGQETVRAIHQDVQTNLQNYRRLSNQECLQQYLNPYGFRPNVLLVSADNDTALEYRTALLTWQGMWQNSENIAYINPYLWTLESWYSVPMIAALDSASIDTWKDKGFHVQYCLQAPNPAAEQSFADCRVQCAPLVLLVTSVFNLFKALGVLWLITGRSQNTICTLGDAIASFLKQPDPTTADSGVMTLNSVRFALTNKKRRLIGSPQVWRPRKTKWLHAGSKRRWYSTMLMSAIVLGFGVGYFGKGLVVIKKYYADISWSALWKLGWGATTYKELIEWNQPKLGELGLFTNIVIANIWQVLLSLCYVTQNALLSCQLVANEWVGFATHRKPLRVSHPVGIQRSTYSVSMPLLYGIPTMVLFAVEHWLLSQTTFIVRVTNFNLIQTPFAIVDGWTTTGYSIMPAMFAFMLPAVLMAAQLANAFLRHYPQHSAMPLVSTCSLAISSNCHRPQADMDAHLLPVQWGVIEKLPTDVQQCSFTTLRTVAGPAEGSLILGLPDAPYQPSQQWWIAFLETTGLRSRFAPSSDRISRIMAKVGLKDASTNHGDIASHRNARFPAISS